MSYPISDIRKDFPILQQTVHGKPLVYLDNSATTQKPKQVIDSITKCYTEYNSNIHRGIHKLSQVSTLAYEEARETVASFINADDSKEVIFTKGTTDSINTIAFSFGETLKEGDHIIISVMEHHSNMVPWQILAERKKLKLSFTPILENGELDMDAFELLLQDDPKLVSIVHVSNSLGTVNPVKDIITKAHAAGAKVLLDAAQSIQHIPVDVQDLDCDFLAFSGHKIYGPTGIGVLYGKAELLDAIPPYQGGGDMIETVSIEKPIFNKLPFKFEAGTANYVGAIAMAEAINYVLGVGLDAIGKHEGQLLQQAEAGLKAIPNVTIYGNAKHKAGAISFLIDGAHAADVGMVLDKQGIAIRTGTHCTEPIMQFYGVPGTARMSFGMYNTAEEVAFAISTIERVQMMFA